MTKPHALVTRLYDKVILEHPGIVLLCLLAAVALFAYKAKDFKLEASTETLIIETDEDLHYSRIMASRYGGYDYLLMTYSPKKDLLAKETIQRLARLRDELKKLKRVASVVSILDAPLLQSPPVPVKDLINNIQTLESPGVDLELARNEFQNSPLYRNLLVSPDLKTTALQINFQIDEEEQELIARRDYLREKQADGTLTAAAVAELQDVLARYQDHQDKSRKIRHRDIAAIRAIMDEYRGNAELFLGGVSLITDDLVWFIKKDLKVFGIGIALFLIITLGIIFRKRRWVIFPMLCCVFSGISMIGLLGTFGWRVTIISSNFISLQLIITMAITIHLIVRYRDLSLQNPATGQRQLLLDTVGFMLTPCLYAALTTIAGFGSLLLCDILPVRTFGWMMSAGIVVSLVVTFLFFPAGLMLMRKEQVPQRDGHSNYAFTASLARFTERHGIMILIVCGAAFIISAVGISRLVVENSFINYFKDTTEIYQGMKVIDQKLGGTTPLDVIVEVETDTESEPETGPKNVGKAGSEFDAFDEFEKGEDEKYWFTSEKMALAIRIHDYLESLPETGKVLSLATMLKIAAKLNDGKPLDNFQLALVYSQLPKRFKRVILKPYVSPKHDQLRYSIRVKDTEESLRRNLLLEKIRHDLINRVGLREENVHLTGLLVLYNNMLQSLFESQILTLGVVILALMAMILVLFRSFKIAVIAMAPNLLAVAIVLGVMGWLRIPLDMMTITIAAISVGIAVDNTIHYVYRFRYEFQTERDYMKTVHQCHRSIGRALYYTSLTIIIGFSILALSNFVPSVYFGLLTGLAMFIALFAALTLLPELLLIFKPFGPEAGGTRG
jgi:predicted RND superfamily exporter protein